MEAQIRNEGDFMGLQDHQDMGTTWELRTPYRATYALFPAGTSSLGPAAFPPSADPASITGSWREGHDASFAVPTTWAAGGLGHMDWNLPTMSSERENILNVLISFLSIRRIIDLEP